MRPTRVLLICGESSPSSHVGSRLSESGYATRGVASVDAAHGLVGTWRPDAILFDVSRSNPEGFEALASLRRLTRLPIVAIGGASERADCIRALDLGADDFLTVPVDYGVLLARLRALLRRSRDEGQAQPAVAFRRGDLRVDYEREAVWVGGAAVRLTPTEYRLLRELTLSAGSLLARSHLLTRVWGVSGSADSGYLTAFIRRLRRKIEPDPRRPVYILTEHRAGYRFVGPGSGSGEPDSAGGGDSG